MNSDVWDCCTENYVRVNSNLNWVIFIAFYASTSHLLWSLWKIFYYLRDAKLSPYPFFYSTGKRCVVSLFLAANTTILLYDEKICNVPRIVVMTFRIKILRNTLPQNYWDKNLFSFRRIKFCFKKLTYFILPRPLIGIFVSAFPCTL